MTKSIAPFQLRISIHRIIERKIRENRSPHIYNYVMLKVICQQLFNNLITSISVSCVSNQATTQYTQIRPENNECHYITSL